MPGCKKRYRLPDESGAAYTCKNCGEVIVAPGGADTEDELSPEMTRSIDAFAQEAAKDLAHELPCPHCGEMTFSRSSTRTLGPARSISCPNCGGKVSVPWSTGLIAMAIVIVPPVVVGAILIASGTQNKAFKFVPLLVMAAMFPVMFRYWSANVRLVKR